MRAVMGVLLLVTVFLLTSCAEPDDAAMRQERLKKCTEHFAHIQGLNDGRYGRQINENYAAANQCSYHKTEINKQYIDGYKFGMANK